MGLFGDAADQSRPPNHETSGKFNNPDVRFSGKQFSPRLLSGGNTDGEDAEQIRLQNSVSFDDTLTLEDGFETQVLDIGDEIELVNLGGETQAVDVEDSVPNSDTQPFLDNDTEIVVDTEGESSEKTTAINDAEEFSDDASGKRVPDAPRAAPVYMPDGVLRHNLNGILKPTSVASITELDSSGSMPRGFTAIRAASMRASGLAACRRASKGGYSKSHSTLSNSQCVRMHDGERDECSLGRDVSKPLKENEMKESISKAGRSTARKLFAEDGNVDSVQELDADVCNAGLSYVDSQEPGELSQANALDFVDRFLKVSSIEFDHEDDNRKSVSLKSNPALIAKGAHSLAKSTAILNTAGEREIYDWDDNREDEGGGEFFRKKKEAFFDPGGKKRRPFTRSLKAERCKDTEQRYVNGKSSRFILSDSKVVLANCTSIDERESCVTGSTFRKNLIKELDEGLELGSKNGILDISTENDVPELLNGRFDTQMAAEAMEELKIYDNSREGFRSLPKSCSIGEERSLYARKSQRRPGISYSGVVTRQSKLATRTASKFSEESSVLSPKRPSEIGKESSGELVKEPQRTNENVKECATSHGSEGLRNARVSVIGKRKNKIHPKRSDVDTIETKSLTASVEQLSVKRQRVFRTFTPVACRTRKSMKSNHLDSVKCSSSGVRDEMIDLTGFYPRRRRTHRKSSCMQEAHAQSNGMLAQLNTCLDRCVERKTRSSVARGSALNAPTESADIDRAIHVAVVRGKNVTPASECTTPVTCAGPVSEASPLCLGDEYFKQSCRKNLSRSFLKKELERSVLMETERVFPIKDLRRRRNIGSVLVLFSGHLSEDIIKQQKKILSRLGGSVASSISDATHFVADEFVRTRNMLEAIAFGKPVVTHLWLESCGQASLLVDERNYVLRDAKKEKEFGFSLPVSLARACRHPLLQGRRVLITPNTKPGKDILASLVKAVHGLRVERIGRTVMKDGIFPDDLLVLSCEEDYAICVPFLEKGAGVYSSELLLNGIVTQELEYERHSLFVDSVKRTRSTIWVKDDSNRYTPGAKFK